MRTIVIPCVVAAVTACALLFLRERVPKEATKSDKSEEVAKLQNEVAALQGRVQYAEAVGAAAIQWQASASKPTDPAPAKPDASAPMHEDVPSPGDLPRNPPTPKQAVAAFRTYFEEIDALRGPGSDTALTQKVWAAVDGFDWKLTEGAGPTDKSVVCNNGYCRVKLSFKELHDAEQARMGLSMAAGPVLGGRMSVFLDPATQEVEGYFGESGVPFPPFPDQVVAENAR